MVFPPWLGEIYLNFNSTEKNGPKLPIFFGKEMEKMIAHPHALKMRDRKKLIDLGIKSAFELTPAQS